MLTSLVNISMQKNKENDALLPEILMIRESGNLIGRSHFGLTCEAESFHIPSRHLPAQS